MYFSPADPPRGRGWADHLPFLNLEGFSSITSNHASGFNQEDEQENVTS